MTEPSPQEETISSDLKTVENVENPESALQEVHVNNLSDKCGGVSNQSEEKDNSEIQQDEDCNGDIVGNGNGKKGKGKNVKFPDGGFVASYDEPKDPWKNAEYWTTEELVQAYKKSCEKHGVKPLIRLVQQLQKFTCTGKRQENLVLKGEKLDQKQCECLEEVFRRVQFKIVDLEASHIDDECAVALFDMIEFYCSASQLNISFNKNIGIRGWQACSRLIRRTPCLTALDMRNCDLNERSIPIMGRALKMGSHLTILHLENIYLSGRPLVILVAALKMNENLLELFLADNKLMPSDGIQLGILLKYNHKLELLDLRNNHLQDVGTRHVCDGLSEQILERGLFTLVLWNNQITYQGMSPVANCLAVVKYLETLNLGHNNITNEGIHQLKEGLLKNRSLLRLGLQGTKISCEGAVALAEYVAESTKLLRLDLRENDIKTAGLMGLSLALTVNETVTRIDLDKDTKKEAGVRDYADQQKRLHQQIIWYQERNQVRALEREEDERRKLEERAQHEADQRQAAKELKEAKAVEEAMEYIPSVDKIQRPKLLFSADTPAQQTLDSPSVMVAQSDAGLTKVLSPTETPLSLLSPPPAELLKSPQYSPRLSAKKIFTVSRVKKPSQAASPVVESPVSKISQTLDQKPLVVSPGTLCQNMASETMNDYIEQIVSEAIQSEILGQSSLQNAQKPASNNDNMQSKISINSEGEPSSFLPSLLENEEASSENVLNDKFTVKSVPDSSVSALIDANNVQVQSDPVSENVKSLRDNSDAHSDYDLPTKHEVIFDSENGRPVELTDSIVAELSVPESLPLSTEDNPALDVLPSSEDKTNNSESVTTDNNLNIEKSQNHLNDKVTDSEASSGDSLLSVKSQDGDVSNEQDPWLKIDSLDLIQQNKLKSSAKPDFHTNLTMNGLTEELASALDISEESLESNESSENKDNFEEELDSMIRQFQSDIDTRVLPVLHPHSDKGNISTVNQDSTEPNQN